MKVDPEPISNAVDPGTVWNAIAKSRKVTIVGLLLKEEGIGEGYFFIIQGNFFLLKYLQIYGNISTTFDPKDDLFFKSFIAAIKIPS